MLCINLQRSPQGVCGGVIRGVGKQKVGALCNLVGHYFIGFPIGVALTFAAKMGIVGKPCMFCNQNVSFETQERGLCFLTGLWTGLTICVLIQAIFFLLYLYKLDWKRAAEEVGK